MKPPAFQFYAGNFLNGVAEFSCEEVGAYIRLLCYQWDRGGLPSDPKKLCILAGCTNDALASIIGKFASCEDGMLRNARLEECRYERKLFSESRSKNAQAGWEGKKGDARRDALASKVNMQDASTNGCTDDGLQSMSLTNRTKTPPTPRDPFASVPTILELPFSSKQFTDAWEDWVQHRKEIKKPLKPQSIKQQLIFLAKLGEGKAIAAIRHTILKGWQGLVEADEKRIRQIDKSQMI